MCFQRGLQIMSKGNFADFQLYFDTATWVVCATSHLLSRGLLPINDLRCCWKLIVSKLQRLTVLLERRSHLNAAVQSSGGSLSGFLLSLVSQHRKTPQLFAAFFFFFSKLQTFRLIPVSEKNLQQPPICRRQDNQPSLSFVNFVPPWLSCTDSEIYGRLPGQADADSHRAHGPDLRARH